MSIRDSQRSKVYKWERAIWKMVDLKATLSFDECKALISLMNYRANFVYARRGAIPDVKDGRGCRKAFYSPSRHEITLPKWARSRWVVCHEMAHALVDTEKYEAHGAEFMAVLIKLLSNYAKGEHGFSEDGLRAMAIDMGIRVNHNFTGKENYEVAN